MPQEEPIEFEPGESIEALGGEAGEKFDLLGLAARGRAVELGGLRGKGEPDLLGAHRSFEDGSDFNSSLVELKARGVSRARGSIRARSRAFLFYSRRRRVLGEKKRGWGSSRNA